MGKPTLGAAIGPVAGLVVITPAAGLEPWAAIVMGLMALPVRYLCHFLLVSGSLATTLWTLLAGMRRRRGGRHSDWPVLRSLSGPDFGGLFYTGDLRFWRARC